MHMERGVIGPRVLSQSEGWGVDVLPENWSRGRERKSGKIGNKKGELSDEKDPLYRRADRLGLAAGGDGHAGWGGHPEDGHLHADFL